MTSGLSKSMRFGYHTAQRAQAGINNMIDTVDMEEPLLIKTLYLCNIVQNLNNCAV